MLKMFLDAPNYNFFLSEAVLCCMNGCYTEVIQVKTESVKWAGEKAMAILV